MHRRPLTAALLIFLAASSAAMLSACAERSDSAEVAAPEEGAWVLATAPEGAASVTEARERAAQGETIAIRGRIGGRSQPISGESPVLTLVDLSLPHCGENPEDGCPTPWDYCCETPETIAAHSATVLVVDASGNPLENLSEAGLEPLDEIVAVGTVTARPDDGALTLRATGIHRAKP